MGALRQYYYYWRIERKGASGDWCRAGQQRAIDQIRWNLLEAARLIISILCALIVSLALYILTGGK
jgi:hypothetical protein